MSTTQTTTPVVISRQQQSLQNLKDALVAANINTDNLIEANEGSTLNVLVDDGWPTIRIGRSGGFDIKEVRSYPKADLATMVNAKALFEAQNARDAKRQAAKLAETAAADKAAAVMVGDEVPVPTGKVADAEQTVTPSTELQNLVDEIASELEQDDKVQEFVDELVEN